MWLEGVFYRVIQLNAVPYSMTFCSEKGDLLLGIGDHVHKIDYKRCKYYCGIVFGHHIVNQIKE